jgi:uncharacterized Zn-finger protein
MSRYSCNNCGYFTDNKQNYERHQTSAKHKELSNKKEKENEKIYECKNCDKKFITNGGLWKHKKTCEVKKEPQNVVMDENLLCNLIENNRDKILQILLKNTANDNGNQLVLYNRNNELVKFDEKNIINEVIEIKQEMKIMDKRVDNMDKRVDKLEEKFNFYIKNYCKDNINYSTFIENLHITQDFCKEFSQDPCEPIINLLKNEFKKCGLENSPVYCMMVKDYIAVRLKKNNEWESFNYDDTTITVINEIAEPLIEKIKTFLEAYCTKEIQNKNSYKQHYQCLNRIQDQKDILDNGLYEPTRIDSKKINKLIEIKGSFGDDDVENK